MSTSNNQSFKRVLVWDDVILDLQDALSQIDTPVYIVGGAVRDAFLRRPLKDVDLVTPESGIKLGRKIANALGGDFYPLDADRDVGRALIETPNGKLTFDVASFRAADLESDLRDRDFTINAMAVDVRGDLNEIIDPTGGERDLITKTLRRCNPNALTDDSIRALRGVRQSVKFGLHIDPETVRDIRAAGLHLTENSPERLRDEFFQLLELAKPDVALRIADMLGLLSVIVPQIEYQRALPGTGMMPNGLGVTFNAIGMLSQIVTTISPRRTDETAAQFTFGMLVMALDRFRKPLQSHVEAHYANDRSHRALLILAGLLWGIDDKNAADAGSIWETVATTLRLSNSEKDRFTAIARHQSRFAAFWNDEPTPVSIYRYWRDTDSAGIDIILLTMAFQLARAGQFNDQDAWLHIVETARTLLNAYFEQRDQLVDPPMLVDGRDLMATLNLKPGRLIGELLEAIRELQVEGSIRTRDEALAFALQRISHNGTTPHQGV